MSGKTLGFGARLAMFFSLPWRLLFDGALAARLASAADGQALPSPEPAQAPTPTPAPPPEPVAEVAPEVVGPDYTPALQVLAILQREGRFVDFLQEDVGHFSDAEIGAAARVVHAGCKKALDEYVTLAPVRDEPDGARVTLEPGFDALRHRLTGNVVGEPPYAGELAHPGWQVIEIELPTLSPGHDARIVAPAEVELT